MKVRAAQRGQPQPQSHARVLRATKTVVEKGQDSDGSVASRERAGFVGFRRLTLGTVPKYLGSWLGSAFRLGRTHGDRTCGRHAAGQFLQRGHAIGKLVDPSLKTRKLAAELVRCTPPPAVNGEETQEACLELEGMSSISCAGWSVAKSAGSFAGKTPPQLIRVRKDGRTAVCGMLGTVGGPLPSAVCPVHPIRDPSSQLSPGLPQQSH